MMVMVKWWCLYNTISQMDPIWPPRLDQTSTRQHPTDHKSISPWWWWLWCWCWWCWWWWCWWSRWLGNPSAKTLYPAWKRQRVRCIRCKKSRCLEEAERKKQSWQTEGNSDHGHHFLSLLGHILGPALVSLGIISIVLVQLMITIEHNTLRSSMMDQKF